MLSFLSGCFSPMQFEAILLIEESPLAVQHVEVFFFSCKVQMLAHELKDFVEA